MAIGSNEIEDKNVEYIMNGSSFIIDILINGSYSVPILIDNGCKCLAADSNSLVCRANLPRIKINTQKLTEAAKNQHHKEYITEMVKMDLDVDRYERMLYAYVIPGLSHELILGRPWMEREDIIYNANDHFMDIGEAVVNNQPLRVLEKGQQKTTNASLLTANIKSLLAGVFLATVRKARKASASETQLFSITLADIQKALAPSKKSLTNLERLPNCYHEFANLFRKELTDELPPHRQGCDHEIRLESDKKIPWEPLYGMSRDELLVLRKTLTDLLDKNYICASSSPAGAPGIICLEARWRSEILC